MTFRLPATTYRCRQFGGGFTKEAFADEAHPAILIKKECIMANVSGSQQQAQQARPQAGGQRPGAEHANGKNIIDDGVVAKIAGIAARDVRGVYALGAGAARMVGAIRDALNSTDLAQGISVEVGERQVAVDVTIVAEYPVALQDLADRVREAVGKAMRELVGLDVAEVNVTVDDVHIPSDDDDADDSARSESKQGKEARVQ